MSTLHYVGVGVPLTRGLARVGTATFGWEGSARQPRVGKEHDAKPVGVDEGDAVCLPVRICRRRDPDFEQLLVVLERE
jgi:hypothetical protein